MTIPTKPVDGERIIVPVLVDVEMVWNEGDHMSQSGWSLSTRTFVQVGMEVETKAQEAVQAEWERRVEDEAMLHQDVRSGDGGGDSEEGAHE